MSNATRVLAALSVAGAVLATSSASFAQEAWRAVYPPRVVVYVDTYYNTQFYPPVYAGGAYGAYAGAYGAYAGYGPFGYDAYGAVGATGYAPEWYGPSLRGADWVGIHGAQR